MRSYLFVPADSPRKMEKALASGADSLILDLEDSVAPANKVAARAIIADFLNAQAGTEGPALYVRINAFDSGLSDDDLTAIVPMAPAGIVLPKCACGADVAALGALIGAAEADAGLADGGIAIVPIATETPDAIFNLGTYAGASARLSALSWGAEDLSAAIGALTNRDKNGAWTTPYTVVRTLALMGAAAADIDPVDTVYTNFRDHDGLARECAEAARDGFVGKLAIHPAQIPIINEAFTPSAATIAEARKIIALFNESGDGVAGLDGEMLDRPHLRRAERIVARAGTTPS